MCFILSQINFFCKFYFQFAVLSGTFLLSFILQNVYFVFSKVLNMNVKRKQFKGQFFFHIFSFCFVSLNFDHLNLVCILYSRLYSLGNCNIYEIISFSYTLALRLTLQNVLGLVIPCFRQQKQLVTILLFPRIKDPLFSTFAHNYCLKLPFGNTNQNNTIELQFCFNLNIQFIWSNTTKFFMH